MLSLRVRWILVLAACGRAHFDSLASDAGKTCIQQVSSGASHSCALLTDGTIRCWGSNTNGQLGNGALGDSATPVTVLATANGAPFLHATQISCGVEASTCALRGDHTAWCWGWNMYGQLGNQATTNSSLPVEVTTAPGTPLTDIAEIVMGERHACARRTNGTVWCWGLNNEGELGNGTLSSSLVPVQVIAGGGPFVAAGLILSYESDCAWDGGGQLYCWGWNMYGQVGDGTTTAPKEPLAIGLGSIASVASAWRTTCASTAQGNAYCWGYGSDGELGDGTYTAHPTPAPVLVAAGGADLTGVVEVGLGDATSCARRSDGSVWCWGSNGYGQLGTGLLSPATQASPVPVALPAQATALAVGNDHACALLADGSVVCWGENQHLQLATNGVTASATPVPIAIGCP